MKRDAAAFAEFTFNLHKIQQDRILPWEPESGSSLAQTPKSLNAASQPTYRRSFQKLKKKELPPQKDNWQMGIILAGVLLHPVDERERDSVCSLASWWSNVCIRMLLHHDR